MAWGRRYTGAMKPREFDPRKLDVAAAAKAGARLAGQWPLADFGRLRDVQAAQATGALAWQAELDEVPQRGGKSRLGLNLSLDGRLQLQCQRCLAPCPHEVALQRRFWFADDEAEAERLDADLEDDVLALTRHLDLHELAEDEVLLDLPLVPRHEVCPQPLVAPAAAGADEPAAAEAAPEHPFAALAAWKRGSA